MQAAATAPRRQRQLPYPIRNAAPRSVSAESSRLCEGMTSQAQAVVAACAARPLASLTGPAVRRRAYLRQYARAPCD